VADVLVPVTWVLQERLYSCGPAIAQMMLDALGVAPPATPPSWQDQLWPQVQAQALGTRPAGAGPGTPYAPSFPSQLCEQCETDDPFTCWATSPDALQRVLNAGQASAQFVVSPAASESAATTLLFDTLDAGIPAAALVRGWQHWVVVDGYQHSDPDPWAIPGRSVNGVYIRNAEVQGIHWVSWRTWRRKYLSVVPCGRYANTFVVINGARRVRPPVTLVPPTSTPAPAAPTNLRIV